MPVDNRRESQGRALPVALTSALWRALQSCEPASAGSGLHSPYRMLAGENIGSRFVVPTVASSVDLLVHVGIDAHGRRLTHEIAAVPGRVENDLIEIEPLFGLVDDRLVRLSGLPPRAERFTRAGYDLHRLLHADDLPVESVAAVGDRGR